jgi:sensor histidine kinase regulating citrate/malate metabolism
MLFTKLIDKRVAEFQSGLMEKHIAEVQNIYREMRGWRHDYHNHIQVMKSYIALGQAEQLGEYLDKLDADLRTVDKLVKSGNVMVDAILNSKLSLAKNRKIAIDAKASVPEAFIVNGVDLCVIIGNLLDNAMEACAKLPEPSRFIRVYIDVKRGELYISVTNSAPGRPKKNGGRYVSAKSGYHGLGLTRADRIVDKYGGWLKRADEDGVFTSEVLLPIFQSTLGGNPND